MALRQSKAGGRGNSALAQATRLTTRPLAKKSAANVTWAGVLARQPLSSATNRPSVVQEKIEAGIVKPCHPNVAQAATKATVVSKKQSKVSAIPPTLTAQPSHPHTASQDYLLRECTPEPPQRDDLVAMEISTAKAQRKLQFVEDTDEDEDRESQLYCAEYVNDIFTYLYQLEVRVCPSPSYMDHQPYISHKMRCILVDWLVLVQVKFTLLQETLFLTIAIVDRFLTASTCTKEELQLLGVTAMFIASKYEEIHYPQLSDFVYITDNTYSEDEVKAMERQVLRAIDYNLASPTPITFLRRFSKVGEVTPEMHMMAKFLMELSLTDYAMLRFLPSQLAASSLCLAMKLFHCKDNQQWPQSLESQSSYSERELQPCMSKLAQLVGKMTTAKQQAVREKYSIRSTFKVAKMPALTGDTIKDLAKFDHGNI